MRRELQRMKRVVAVTILGTVAAAGVAHADVNPAPIAIPLIGDHGVASPYPSRVHVTARGGPTMNVQPIIVLQKVTHPCLQDLAVLAVHNGVGYSLLSNAGGCRPLHGVDLTIQYGQVPLPASDSSTVPYEGELVVGPSNYGTTPVFPSPAPAGPYTDVLAFVLINGDWDLYVFDTGAGHRGVMAAGWAITYSTDVKASAAESMPTSLPAGAPATTSGPAQHYPLTFDLTGVPAGVPVTKVVATVNLTHNHASDVNLVLQAPNGRAVTLLANCGGGFAVSDQLLIFSDDAPGPAPGAAPLTGLEYKPTLCFGSVTMPGGPLPPFGSALSTLNGQDARGTWKLWAYDDSAPDSGLISLAQLKVSTDVAPTFTITVPTSGTTYQATTPFLHLEGLIGPVSGIGPYSATWTSMVGGQYYQSGPMTILAGTNTAVADIPMQSGTNFLTVTVWNTNGTETTDDLDVNVAQFVYTLSEGSTGGFFDLYVTVTNPTGADAPIHVDFLPEGLPPIPYDTTVVANGQNQMYVNNLPNVPAGALSTVVHAPMPVAVERTMSWDKAGYGGSGGTAIVPATQWLFGEGSQGYFDTFILLANDGDNDANATVRFLVEGGSPVDVPVVVPTHKRVTVYAGDITAVRNTSFGLDISADRPITAERSMYFPHDGPRIWEGGHEAAGANATSTHWFLAEGATGPFFECFILLSNPNSSVAHATLTYLLPDGTTLPQTIAIPAAGRQTINVETVDPKLANVAVSTTITSDVGIIVERSMYWPDISIGWREAHNSVGVTDARLRWAISDGRLGGARAYQTYILLANPNSTPAEVLVRLLRAGQAPVTKTYTLLPTSRLNIGPDVTGPLLGEGVFSADIQVLNYQPIVVEKAMYWNSGTEVWAAGTGTVGVPIPPQ